MIQLKNIPPSDFYNGKIKVLIVNTALYFGGAETRTLIEAQALQLRGVTCGLFLLKDSPLHVRARELELDCHPVDIRRGNPLMALALYKIIKHHGYQLVNAHNTHSIVWSQVAARASPNCGRIATIHSDVVAEMPGVKGLFYHWLCLSVFRSNTQYVTVTEKLQTQLQQTRIGNNSSLVHNGIQDRTHYSNKPAQWPFSDDDFVIGCVARLVDVKGHNYLLQAIAELSDKPEIKLALIGDGSLRSSLETQAAELDISDRVKFLGYRNDLDSIYSHLDVACLASMTEAMPFTLLEAAMHEIPIVATAVGGIPTLFEDNVSALLVAPRDHTALALKFRLLCDDRKRGELISEQAKLKVKRLFSIEQMTDKLIDVFCQALPR